MHSAFAAVGFGQESLCRYLAKDVFAIQAVQQMEVEYKNLCTSKKEVPSKRRQISTIAKLPKRQASPNICGNEIYQINCREPHL